MKKRKNADPAHDVLGYERLPLDAIFRPETVALIGATDRPGSVGRTIMWNLVSNPFGGMVFPVNERRQNRSEEHTSELQSRQYLVCRLLLEKKITTYSVLTRYSKRQF